MKRSVLFVINPISGGKSKKHLPEIIHQKIDYTKFEVNVFWWNEVSTLEAELNAFVEKKGYMVVAAGGDGTVNLIARCLMNKDTILAILPLGSGNGLARQTGFNLSIETFLTHLNNHKSGQFVQMDVGLVNGKSFVNIAGLGFDAQISSVFSEMKERGFWSYAKAVIGQFRQYPNHKVKISFGSNKIEAEAFIVDVANGSQWGNNFFIAPKALLDDGQLDLVLVRKPTFWQLIPFLIALRTAKPHSCMSYHRSESFNISSENEMPMHLDGEPTGTVKESSFTVLRNAIRLMDMR